MINHADKVDEQEFKFVKSCVDAGKDLNFKIISGSMEPLIKIGDQVEIKPIKSEKLKKFDVIIFHQTDKLICHYVRHINKTQFGEEPLVITQGLNSRGEDFPVAAPQILGLVTSHRLTARAKFSYYFKILIKRLFTRG